MSSDLKKLKDAIVELYIKIKVRTNDEVFCL